MRAGSPAVAEQRQSGMAASRDRLGQVYAAYQPWLVRFIGHRVDTRDRHWAEDFAQSTFLSAWPTLAQADFAETGSPRPWLATIARRVLADRYHCGPGLQRAAETPVAPDSPLFQGATPASRTCIAVDVTDGREAALKAALDTLPMETRRVLELRYLQGMSRRKAARDMGRGTATIDRRTAAGLAALRGNAALEAAVTVRETEPMIRARHAVAEVQQRRAALDRRRSAHARAQQLAGWRAEDQALEERVADWGAPALAVDGAR